MATPVLQTNHWCAESVIFSLFLPMLLWLRYWIILIIISVFFTSEQLSNSTYSSAKLLAKYVFHASPGKHSEPANHSVSRKRRLKGTSNRYCQIL